jgi:predicted nucleic acid-binding protein
MIEIIVIITKKNQVRLQEFLSPLEICDSDKPAASAYGDIRRGLEKKWRANRRHEITDRRPCSWAWLDVGHE